ncbi:hypothetical protein MKW94_022198 [Papaver nudicaule]|uniref:Uncharacterized protein n=1 Tax=Papaver nudicaule TaxID=74823 RepID=A0AA42B2F6_PAPNU|nr:hypothetical protein [Papaver nudicaule]
MTTFLCVIVRIIGVAYGFQHFYKLCSWLAIIFCAQSLASMKNFENDLKQISMAMIGLMNKYWLVFS